MSADNFEKPPPSPLDYAPTCPRNPDARNSFVFGLVPIPIITGILAIHAARRSDARLRLEPVGGRFLAFFGRLMGWLNLIVSAAALVALPFVLIHMHHLALRDRCAANLREIGQAILLYADDHRMALPDSLQTLVSAEALSPNALICPADSTPGLQNPGGCSYKLAPLSMSVEKMYSIHYLLIALCVIAYEPLEYHGDGMHVLFGDGRVEFVDVATARKLLAELSTGHNPPRPEKLK